MNTSVSYLHHSVAFDNGQKSAFELHKDGDRHTPARAPQRTGCTQRSDTYRPLNTNRCSTLTTSPTSQAWSQSEGSTRLGAVQLSLLADGRPSARIR
jgi:hypothetical protein